MRSYIMSKLQFAIVIYGLLYLVFVLLATVPSTRSLIIGNSRPDSVKLELALAQLLFVLFIVGCAASWHNKLIAGLLFLLWYAFAWWMELFSERFGAGGGMGPAIGLPVLIFGALNVLSWYSHRRQSKRAADFPTAR